VPVTNGSKPRTCRFEEIEASKAAAPGKKSVASKANACAKSGNGPAQTKSPDIVRKIKLATKNANDCGILLRKSRRSGFGRRKGGEIIAAEPAASSSRSDRADGPRLVLAACVLGSCRASVERVRAAMCEFWHTAKPVLRLLESTWVRRPARPNACREVEVHGGVNTVPDVADPPKSYAWTWVLAGNGRFHSVIRSNP